MSLVNQSGWISWLADHPQAHLLQTGQWGELKSRFGWKPFHLTSPRCGALIFFRRLPFGVSFGYIPKGPVGEGWEALWPEIDILCQKQHAISMKVEPDLWEDSPGSDLSFLSHFYPTKSATVQPQRTILISLLGSEEEWLERMKPKTRYNIRLAAKKGVRVAPSTDIAAFAQMMKRTGLRDGFGVHTFPYYQQAYQLFAAKGLCNLLIAEYEGKPLAGLMVFFHGKRAWYLFGGSTDEERNRMPNYLIQREAMRWAAAKGCLEYDLWGTPDEDLGTLEKHFETRSDGLWGVYRFKRGFGGSLKRFAGAWERIYYPAIYKVYQWSLRLRKAAIL